MSAAPIYVVVTTHELPPESGDRGKAIVMETPVEGATLEAAQKQAARFDGRYGPCRVARLVFEDHPAFGEVAK